jgi:hypothetical protein
MQLLIEWPGNPEWPPIVLSPIRVGVPVHLPPWMPAAEAVFIIQEETPMFSTVHDVVEGLLAAVRMAPEEIDRARQLIDEWRIKDGVLPLHTAAPAQQAPAAEQPPAAAPAPVAEPAATPATPEPFQPPIA